MRYDQALQDARAAFRSEWAALGSLRASLVCAMASYRVAHNRPEPITPDHEWQALARFVEREDLETALRLDLVDLDRAITSNRVRARQAREDVRGIME